MSQAVSVSDLPNTPAAVAPLAAVHRPRLAHLITRLELGGAQQNTLFCVEHHDRSLFEVSLMSGPGGLLQADAGAIGDVSYSQLDYLEHRVSPLRDLWAVVQLARDLRRRRIDVLHTHSSKAGVVGRLAARLAGVPAVVHTVHGWSFNPTQSRGRRWLYRLLERLTAPLTQRIVVVSSRNQEEGLKLGIGRPAQYRLVRSGIDVDEYRRPARDRESVRRELGIESDQLLVGSIACLKPQKSPLDFVAAAAAAHRRCPRMRFVIAGDGGLRPDVERAIRDADLEGVVQLLGWRRDIPDLLHAFDAFLLTSRFEGLPRAVLQAMAAGVPVVATAVDGTPEVVEDGLTGWLVPVGEPEAAAEALLDRFARPDEALARARRARERIDSEFDIHAMVRRLERIYMSVLEESS